MSHLDFILDIWTFFCYCPTRQEKRPWERDCVWLWWTKTLTNMCFESRFKGTFKVMELGMEVGRALWVGSHGALWKVVTRGQPTGWHPWSASHCLCFRSSKVASFLSLFGVCLLKRGLGYFPWNNKSFWNLNSPLNETLKPCLEGWTFWTTENKCMLAHLMCAPPLGPICWLNSYLNIHYLFCLWVILV